MIEVSHLSKFYGPRAAISDLSFKVGKGEIVGFLGPNGAGKSSTMKILTGFMPASEGKANIAGFDVFDQPLEVKRNVGFLPENPPVYVEMTVEDYIDFAARLHQVPKPSVGKAVDQAIGRTGLGDVRRRLIGNLSKGYRQRVGLAQALVHNPKVLILDEPTVGLDPKQIIEIRELIKSLSGDHTVVLSSHILPEVTATCQRIIVINKGRIVAEDTIERLVAHANRGVVYSLLVKTAAEDALAHLRKIEGISKITAAGQKLLIEIQTGARDIRDQIIETAVAQKMGVLEFTAEKLSLEEVFLQLTTVEGRHEPKGANS
jgi:ABC-2 type transport system ATP-binding protein